MRDEEGQPADDEHTWEESRVRLALGEEETGLGGSQSPSTHLHCHRFPWGGRAPRLLIAGGHPRVVAKGALVSDLNILLLAHICGEGPLYFPQPHFSCWLK